MKDTTAKMYQGSARAFVRRFGPDEFMKLPILITQGHNQREIAEMYGVTHSFISQVMAAVAPNTGQSNRKYQKFRKDGVTVKFIDPLI
jgi:hypothetical protein